ncbi:MAG TPA: SIMPL domain-containing protein [Pyrinomonadaceae bacterium]
MKTFIASVAVLCALALNQAAQNQQESHVIEVSGSAERWITPDEFTFKITLNERIEKKEKITIEHQETALRIELAALGVDVAKDLSIFDLSSAYFRQKKVRDVLGSKDYRLKLRDLNKIARLQEIADRLNVGRLDLIDSEHSEITRLRRETKMDAMKAAKDKADYLLGSIGQRSGKPVYIKEEPDETPRNQASNYSNISSNTFRVSPGVLNTAADDDSLSFSQIRLRYVIVAKFEIE